jgi:SAM-dependent methyltransferase
MSEPNLQEDVQEAVKQKYGEAAKRAASGGTACCGGGAGLSGCDPITKNLYSDAEKGALPEKAMAASLGCGNPTALAKLQPGEVVLDLGSGGGIDVILSARRVGPTGKAYGLDMTDEMLALARENQKKAGVENVEFLKGAIEDVPLPDIAASVGTPVPSSAANISSDVVRRTASSAAWRSAGATCSVVAARRRRARATA